MFAFRVNLLSCAHVLICVRTFGAEAALVRLTNGAADDVAGACRVKIGDVAVAVSAGAVRTVVVVGLVANRAGVAIEVGGERYAGAVAVRVGADDGYC